jgi:Smg protein
MSADTLRERVLAIVSLIAQYVMEERDLLTENELVAELLAVGFEEEEIEAAFRWMETLSLQSRQQPPQLLVSGTHRVFTAEENRTLSTEARGFLIRLRALGILDDELEEEVIERATQAEEELTLPEIKTLVVLTLFTRSHNDWRREVDCIMEDDWSRLYH